MIENKDIAIERALNKAKNEIKSKGEQSKEALEELSKLRRESDLKDKKIESLKAKLEEIISSEHKEKQRADKAEFQCQQALEKAQIIESKLIETKTEFAQGMHDYEAE